MSRESAAGTAAGRAVGGAGRVARAWRALPHERRLAAYAAIGLFLALFLPWYQETVIASGKAHLQSLSASITGWGAFSFVEAAVLLVAAAVLTLLFQRAEGRAFHLPGGDGWVITAAGLWTCALIVWRIFDKQGTSVHGPGATSTGVEWGIFVALAIAAFLTYAGSRIRAAHQPEPPLPGETDRPPAPKQPADHDFGPTVPVARPPIRSPRPVAAERPRTRPTAWEEPPAWEDSAAWRDQPDWMQRRRAAGPATEPMARSNDVPTDDAERPTLPSEPSERPTLPTEPDHRPTLPTEPGPRRTPREPNERPTLPLDPDGDRD
jgi:hypothetical protein